MAFLPSHHPLSAADRIAQVCLSTYHPLEAKYKPKARSNGVREWTVLAGIVLHSTCSLKGKEKATAGDEDYTCVSLGTGVKVLSERALPVHGDALHDSHAEVMARRGFVCFLLHEAQRHRDGARSRWVEPSAGSSMQLKGGVAVHLYVSTLPCGDASTLYTALSQPAEMAALKAADNSTGVNLPSQSTTTARGRSGYEVYGALRTKPGRADSIPSISHSCSDKIATWSVLGLQGALASRIFERPIYLDSIVIGDLPRTVPTEVDMTRYRQPERPWREIMAEECERAFYGRLGTIETLCPLPYKLHRPRIEFTDLSFPFGRWQVAPMSATSAFPPQPTVTDMRGMLYVPACMKVPEPINNGCKGNAVCKLDRTEPVEPRFRSMACRLEMLRAVCELRETNDAKSSHTSYHSAKHPLPTSAYQKAKKILRDNTGSSLRPPFEGWLRSGRAWELFDEFGNVSHDNVQC